MRNTVFLQESQRIHKPSGTPRFLRGVPASCSMADVSLGGVALQALAPEALPAGPATLIARPELLVLLPNGTLAPNQLHGTIRRCQYLGARTVYVVEVEGVTTLRVETHEHQALRSVGERARLQLDARQTRVVAA